MMFKLKLDLKKKIVVLRHYDTLLCRLCLFFNINTNNQNITRVFECRNVILMLIYF